MRLNDANAVPTARPAVANSSEALRGLADRGRHVAQRFDFLPDVDAGGSEHAVEGAIGLVQALCLLRRFFGGVDEVLQALRDGEAEPFHLVGGRGRRVPTCCSSDFVRIARSSVV